MTPEIHPDLFKKKGDKGPGSHLFSKYRGKQKYIANLGPYHFANCNTILKDLTTFLPFLFEKPAPSLFARV